MSPQRVSTDSVVVAAQDQVSCDLAGEAAILDLRSGTYYGLNSVGAAVWSMIQQPRHVGEIHSALIAEYDVEAGRCQADLLVLLDQLAQEKLIEVQGAPRP